MVDHVSDTSPTRTADSATGASPDTAVEPGAPQDRSLFDLGHAYLTEFPELCLEWKADPAPSPAPALINTALADELGLDGNRLNSPEGVEVLSGNRVPDGAVPVALAYAGHQFGGYSPRLGDGRALLLGELTTADGKLLDIHLKGSGRTPFARGGDGKATVGPMLREYVISEALHTLGVPTTRSLGVVTTGEEVWRDRLEPGAVLTRVAASHVRVGTFEYAVRHEESELVRRLADHVIDRHHPEARNAPNPYRELLRTVIDVQARLVARWMSLGFIHGVMNTDNMTLSGEGIDYGPCAFMDRYDPATVFSSIDHAGRYAYANQGPIAAWNLARLAETLLGLMAEDAEEAVADATELVNGFRDRFDAHRRSEMAAKLGFAGIDSPPVMPDASGEDGLFDQLLKVMQADRLDWTLTFRRLADELRGAPGTEPGSAIEVRSAAYVAWVTRWRAALDLEGRDPHATAEAMDAVNPVYIPRNHLVDEALEAATAGDLEPVRELMDVLADPFVRRPGKERFAQPAPDEFSEGFRTFCGT